MKKQWQFSLGIIDGDFCKLLVEDEKEGDTIGQNMDTTGKR